MTVGALMEELRSFPPEVQILAPYPVDRPFRVVLAENGTDVTLDFTFEEDDDVPF